MNRSERAFVWGLAGGYVGGLVAPFAFGEERLSFLAALGFGAAVLIGFVLMRWWMRPWR